MPVIVAVITQRWQLVVVMGFVGRYEPHPEPVACTSHGQSATLAGGRVGTFNRFQGLAEFSARVVSDVYLTANIGISQAVFNLFTAP